MSPEVRESVLRGCFHTVYKSCCTCSAMVKAIMTVLEMYPLFSCRSGAMHRAATTGKRHGNTLTNNILNSHSSFFERAYPSKKQTLTNKLGGENGKEI